MKGRIRRTIPFYKMSGSGNDFILIDNRRRILKRQNLGRLAKAICRHRLSVGGDGLIVLEPPSLRDSHFRWRLFNADGSEAEISGNGSRCAARLAYLIGIAPKKMVFETLAGQIRAEIIKRGRMGSGCVKVEMPVPKDLNLRLKIPLDGQTYLGHFINTGVPHTVLFVEDIDAVEAMTLGRAIRHHKLFSPAGTNVNFAMIINRHRAQMRTYERGVEEETLACGTGAVAIALITGALGQGASPMTLRQKSGMPLLVHYQWDGQKFSQVVLEGDARMIYSGQMLEDAWA